MKKLLMICLGIIFLAPISSPASSVIASTSISVDSFNEIDDLLTQFDKAVDEYIVAAQEAQSGDVDATIKKAKVSVKMSKLANRLANNKEEMSEAQYIRYSTIIAKMSNALK